MSLNPEPISERSPRSGQPTGTPLANEQSTAQEQLRQQWALSPDYAVFTLDLNGFITSWNAGAVIMKRYSAEEAIGQHLSILYTEEARKRDEPMKHLRTALTEGSYHEVGMRVRKGGEVFLADVQITPFYRDGALIGFTKFVSDVTEQGKLRRERDESRAETELLELQKGSREKFVLALIHDLRNPLSAIKSAIQLKRKYPGDQTMHRNLDEIEIRGVERLERMITDILDANRIVARGSLPLSGESFDLLELVNQIVRELSASHGDRFKILDDGPAIGFWDRQALRRAIENLITNALKYGAQDRPVTISLRQDLDHVEVEVHNLGNPIPLDLRESIFEQFRRTKSADEGKAKGWGLGLTLARGIVESHRGKLTLESSPEKSTSFTVKLPRDFRQSPGKET